MTKRAARGASSRRPAPKKRQPARRKAKPGLFEQTMAALPISHAAWKRIATWGIVGLVGAVGFGVASWFGLPAKAGVAMAEAVGEAGFRVQEIEVTGLKRMDRMTVYAQVLDQQSRAMPLVDLAGVRQRLLHYSWIEDARVSRRLPSTLLIHIVEREPAAVWQNKGALTLVDVHGVPLAPVSREAMPDLPLLIGEGANEQELARRKLMDAAPALKPLVRAATWMGNRRWDLLFDTGEKLQLPEGDDAAAAALVRFAELDGTERLLGKGLIRFDMRDPDRLVILKAASAAAPAPAVSPDAIQ